MPSLKTLKWNVVWKNINFHLFQGHFPWKKCQFSLFGSFSKIFCDLVLWSRSSNSKSLEALITDYFCAKFCHHSINRLQENATFHFYGYFPRSLWPWPRVKVIKKCIIRSALSHTYFVPSLVTAAYTISDKISRFNLPKPDWQTDRQTDGRRKPEGYYKDLFLFYKRVKNIIFVSWLGDRRASGCLCLKQRM